MAAKKKSKEVSEQAATPKAAPQERVKRPELPRSEPIRSWSTLFGPAAGAAQGPLRSASDSVQRGVELGYRVIDEYIRQGTSMAATFSNPRGGQGAATPDLPQVTERMMRYATDMSALWFDAMNMMMSNLNAQAANAGASGAAGANTTGGAAPRPSPAPFGSSATPRVVLDVRSPEHAAEVIVALDELAPELEVETLAHVSGLAQGGIDGVKVGQAPGGATRVRVRVPKGLAPGRYSGAVLDSSSRRPVGRITVVLGENEDE